MAIIWHEGSIFDFNNVIVYVLTVVNYSYGYSLTYETTLKAYIRFKD